MEFGDSEQLHNVVFALVNRRQGWAMRAGIYRRRAAQRHPALWMWHKATEPT